MYRLKNKSEYKIAIFSFRANFVAAGQNDSYVKIGFHVRVPIKSVHILVHQYSDNGTGYPVKIQIDTGTNV